MATPYITNPTLCGIGAILLWSSLALLTTGANSIPPFQMAAMTFTIGGLLGLAITILRGKISTLKQPIFVWAVGVGGLFGYHALYFAALQLAPPAQANLINYFWPLLIVVFAAKLLPNERIEPRHILGALCGFGGMCVLLTSNGIGQFTTSALLGFAFAAASSMIWALYSVLSRKLGDVPTDCVTGFCLATALLATLAHFTFEITIIPQSNIIWLCIILAGLGPVGAAFFLWDIGMKRGNIAFLGVASYATPILSTALLIAAGRTKLSLSLGLACALIVGGAVIASKKRA